MENLGSPLFVGPRSDDPIPPILTREISNYESLVNQLSAMGFQERGIQYALEAQVVPNLQSVLTFLLKGEHGYEHPFIPSDDPLICVICNERREEHQEIHDEEEEDRQENYRRSNSDNLMEIHPDNDVQDPCQICFDDLDVRFQPIPGCDKHRFWISWVTNFLNCKISDAQVLRLKWPGHRCNVDFPEDLIQQLVNIDIWEKYERFKEIAILSEDPNIRWCPTPDCGNFMKGSDSVVQLTWEKCGFKLCFKCGERWHEGQSCEEFVDKAYDQWAKGKEVQLCPRCRRRIEKIEGCNHMTWSCGHEWCWLCRGNYSSNHFNPLNPFGWANLQAGEHTRENFPLWRIYLMRMRSCFLIILLILVSPLALAFGPAVAITGTALREMHRGNMERWIKYLVVPIIFIVATILTPIGYAVAIPFLIGLGTWRLIIICYNLCFR